MRPGAFIDCMSWRSVEVKALGLGFRVEGIGYAQGMGFLGFTGFRVQGFGFGVAKTLVAPNPYSSTGSMVYLDPNEPTALRVYVGVSENRGP